MHMKTDLYFLEVLSPQTSPDTFKQRRIVLSGVLNRHIGFGTFIFFSLPTAYVFLLRYFEYLITVNHKTALRFEPDNLLQIVLKMTAQKKHIPDVNVIVATRRNNLFGSPREMLLKV